MSVGGALAGGEVVAVGVVAGSAATVAVLAVGEGLVGGAAGVGANIVWVTLRPVLAGAAGAGASCG
jgi:mannose/fructose/N-acetylgalactosamine-specific phosphotransferase system component IID